MFAMKVGERKVRTDRKHRLTLRIDKELFDKIRVLHFNTDQSYNVLVNKLLESAIASDEIINSLYLAYGRRTGNYVMFWDKVEE